MCRDIFLNDIRFLVYNIIFCRSKTEILLFIQLSEICMKNTRISDGNRPAFYCVFQSMRIQFDWLHKITQQPETKHHGQS